jgi:LPXTG-motif cell wall-anchored protein
MTLVLATAVSVWLLMVVMNTAFPDTGFLVQSTIAVIGGAIIGFFAAWIIRRRNRKSS